MTHLHRYFICSMFVVLLIAFGLMLNAGQANAAVKVFGIGEIGGSFIEILVDGAKTPMGILMFSDYLNNKMVFGLVTSAVAESITKINFSGTYTAVDGAGVKTICTFQASAEDLGNPGDGIDKFSITLSDGYTKSAVLDRGDIKIITN